MAGGARGSRIPSPPPQIIVLVSFCPFAYFNLKFPPSVLDKKLEKLVVTCLVNFSEVKMPSEPTIRNAFLEELVHYLGNVDGFVGQ